MKLSFNEVLCCVEVEGVSLNKLKFENTVTMAIVDVNDKNLFFYFIVLSRQQKLTRIVNTVKE